MKRRDFLKDITIGSILLNVKPGLLAQGKEYPDLALIQGNSPAQLTKEAVALLGGINRFVSKGDVVLVKPNIGWDRT
ncbi:MAG: cytoplasmic protein, partial [Candidatus Aminicenantes bacterium]|nr:cytoplasmic protein [Candidatus Aminicenantes bacterium]